MNKTYIMLLVFVSTAIIISLLLPRQHTIKFSYSQGEEWAHDDLVADFSFPIQKSKLEYNQDIEAAKERFTPIYIMATEVSEGVKNMFAQYLSTYDYQMSSSDMLNEFKSSANNLIDSIYGAGVIINYNLDTVDISKSGFIRVVENGELATMSLKHIYTLDEARAVFESWLNGYMSAKEVGDIHEYFTANIIYDEVLNNTEMSDMLATVSSTKGFIPAGSQIIKSGNVVTASTLQVIDSYKQEYALRNGDTYSFTLLLGNFVYVFIILAISYIFLSCFRKEFSKSMSNVLFILFIYILMVAMSYGVSKFDNLNLYIIPYIIVPFYVVTFYDIRMSIFEYIAVLFLCAPFSAAPVEFLFVNLFTGLAGIFIMQNSYYRQKLFVAVGGMLLIYNLSFISISFMNEPNISAMKWGTLIWFPLNIIIFLALYQLVYLLEKIFGFVTDITLFELCDTNHFLLRELAEKAPGTFQHSVQVANLAEAAAKEIGANPLYARTGALYHDIGKTENPQYFIENSTSEFSLHDKLEPLESAQIIKRHITDGVMLAYRHNLPSALTDFITGHHAKSLIYYFYHQHVSKIIANGEQVDEAEIQKHFRYDGPSPVSKEATICMMADSVEAASRSLKEYTSEAISDLVDSVIDVQLSEGSFEDSLLSYAEIMKVKSVLKSKIETIYHVRIEYPDRK